MDSRACYAHLPAPVMPCVQPQKLLQGQKALLTGARSGIGRAIALSLGDAGADVVINYMSDEDKAEALAEEIRSKGVRARILRADVSDEAQVKSMFSAMLEEFGTVDILVCSAAPSQFESSLSEAHAPLLSARTVELADAQLGWRAGLLTRDPDGHASLIGEAQQCTRTW